MKGNKAVLEINLSQAEQGLRDALDKLESARASVALWRQSVDGARDALVKFLEKEVSHD